MEKVEKFLQKLNPKRRQKVERIMRAIIAGKLQGLNIKALQGYPGCFRCRIGDIRISFYRREEITTIFEIAFRGQAYRQK